ncbi:MAG: NUDIX domain-containing protein [Chlorobi bacterium]|nr:NUDIX domain-containing protein [Chlorobiota bacterium]
MVECGKVGLVFNKKGQFLSIKRFGKWDLPKGKIEKNETIENAAKREVKEECGIENITIKNSLISTYHTYVKNEVNYLKKTHWFTMYNDEDVELIPQAEEGITFAKWFDVNDFHVITENTYLSIIDILKVANIIKKKRKPRFN